MDGMSKITMRIWRVDMILANGWLWSIRCGKHDVNGNQFYLSKSSAVRAAKRVLASLQVSSNVAVEIDDG